MTVPNGTAQWVSFDVAADLLGVSREEVDRLVEDGILTAGEVDGTRWLLRDGVDALARRRADGER